MDESSHVSPKDTPSEVDYAIRADVAASRPVVVGALVAPIGVLILIAVVAAIWGMRIASRGAGAGSGRGGASLSLLDLLLIGGELASALGCMVFAKIGASAGSACAECRRRGLAVLNFLAVVALVILGLCVGLSGLLQAVLGNLEFPEY
ncbi:MAG TPA: hypothetical protein P5081_03425 [Phycisphaerae bacterium]|nr:hypothetical protein [Phycisphaerae bacterium]